MGCELTGKVDHETIRFLLESGAGPDVKDMGGLLAKDGV